MSYYASLVPWNFMSGINFSTPMYATQAAQSMANTVTATNTVVQSTSVTAATSATQSASVTATTSATQSASATATVNAGAAASTGSSAIMTAVATAAVPIAVAVLAVLAAGMTIDLVEQGKQARRDVIKLPTVFTDLQALQSAIFDYDQDGECEMFYDDAQDVLTVRFRLENYVFQRDPDTGFYNLTVTNAGTCRRVAASVNAIQEAYTGAVRQMVCNQLFDAAGKNGWEVESDFEDGEDRVITLLV